MAPKIRRLLLIAVLVGALTAGMLRAQAITPPQPEFPSVPLTCDPIIPVPQGISVSYSPNPTLDSPFATSMHTQATNFVRQGTFYAAQRQYAIAQRYFTYAIDRLTYLYNL